MVLNKNEIYKMDGYYVLGLQMNTGLNAFISSSQREHKVFTSYQAINVNYKVTHNSIDVRSLMTIPNYIIQDYDLIIYNTNNKYDGLTSQKLKMYARRIAEENQKKVTVSYSYLSNRPNVFKEVQIFYAIPTLSLDDKYEIFDKGFTTDNLLDLVAYKHDEKDKILKYRIKELKKIKL